MLVLVHAITIEQFTPRDPDVPDIDSNGKSTWGWFDTAHNPESVEHAITILAEAKTKDPKGRHMRMVVESRAIEILDGKTVVQTEEFPS